MASSATPCAIDGWLRRSAPLFHSRGTETPSQAVDTVRDAARRQRICADLEARGYGVFRHSVCHRRMVEAVRTTIPLSGDGNSQPGRGHRPGRR
eukprot:CAMPEP_0182819334 /NCGR_PEP_ID=MMETSP0006_2-20121128/12520_1 /TAXON_ID=97485 /ORGANISM="Prymnesium parvum, Strain Texoma1" /LENGTH=93 /DNA_ID=CAMNT_0024945895 /DNA_START=571 /DNA_END=852 /DNA_ORIENTATION=-